MITASALADPTNPSPPPYRELNGVGDATTQDVMNAFSNEILDEDGDKLIASWDATGSVAISTGIPTTTTLEAPMGAGKLIAAVTALDPPVGLGAGDVAFFDLGRERQGISTRSVHWAKTRWTAWAQCHVA